MKNSHKKINTILREGAMVVLSTIAREYETFSVK